MAIHRVWAINLLLLLIAFLLFRWDWWNPIASINLLVWLLVIIRKRMNHSWHLPVAGPMGIALAIVMLFSGILLLYFQAPTALWLFALLHAIAFGVAEKPVTQ